jgi:predicted alpha/beta superfamily hydrolase
MKIIDRQPSNTLLRTEMWTVQPDQLDRRFLLSVTTPENRPPDRPLRGLIATDGNMCAGTVFQTATFLEMEGALPPHVLVTIGYPLDNAIPMVVARNRDLTPSAWPDWDRAYGVVLEKDCPPSGDANAFLAFITEELQPVIEDKLGVDPGEWTLAGHSLGGLFATHALLAAPGRFRRLLAVGSSYWWLRPTMFDRAEAFARETGELDVAVFLSAGDRETEAALREGWQPLLHLESWQRYLEVMNGIPDIVADTRKMAAMLARRPGCRTKAQVFENESHGSAALVAFSQGLRWLNAS